MSNSITWVGMDVHAENIAVAAIRGDAENLLSRWETPNTRKGLERLVERFGELGEVRCVYEAGPCGYDLRRFLEAKGIRCDVAAPSLIPRAPGDRVKTDKKDAEKLARLHRLGELSTVCVPTPTQEALRDLVRSREDAREDLMRRRHRLSKFLLRQGRRYEGRKWTQGHWNWIRRQTFADRNSETVLSEYIVAVEQERERIARLEERIEEASKSPALASTVARLRTLRGVDTLTAMTVLSEVIDLRQFASPGEWMAHRRCCPARPVARQGGRVSNNVKSEDHEKTVDRSIHISCGHSA